MSSRRRSKRITDTTTCIDIDLDTPIICCPCYEKKQKVLNSRVMKSRDDSRPWNQCRQPWVLRGESQNDHRIYNAAWTALVDDLGYPHPKLHGDTDGGRTSRTTRKISIASRNKEMRAMHPSDSDKVDPPVETIAITTDDDSSSLSDLSPERSPESMQQQNTTMLEQMVLRLSSELSVSQCETLSSI
jgi:hypothetical protein